MAILTFTVNAGAAGTTTRSMTIANADLGRVVEWAKHNLFGALDPETITNEQAISQWALWLIEQTRAQVREYEKRAAAIPDIPIT